MAKLYVGNPTNQNHRFYYTLPEAGMKEQLIPLGEQRQIGSELSMDMIDLILQAHVPYGMVRDDARPPPQLVPLIYSIDRPIKPERMQIVGQHNQNVLIRRGEDTRRAAAIQIAGNIEDRMFERQIPDRLTGLDVSVQEDGENPQFAEGVQVRRDDSLLSGPRRGSARAGRRRADA